MDDIKIVIDNLSEKDKKELYEYLKNIINTEFEFEEKEVHSCHKCNSTEIVKLGKYNSMQRYRCKNCGVAFTSKSKSIFATTKLEKEKWIKYAECFIDCLSLRRCAEKVGVCLKTSYFMRHRILECIKQNKSQFIINENNKGQLDETYLRENFKGNHTKSTDFSMPRKPRKNGNASKLIGSSNEQICIATGINDTNNVFLEIAGRGQLTNNSLKDILKDKIESECVISTDKRSNYKTILKLFNIKEHNTYKSNTTEAYKNLANVNSLHSRFKEFIKKLHGVSTRRLENYLVSEFSVVDFNKYDVIAYDANTKLYIFEGHTKEKDGRGYVIYFYSLLTNRKANITIILPSSTREISNQCYGTLAKFQDDNTIHTIEFSLQVGEQITNYSLQK